MAKLKDTHFFQKNYKIQFQTGLEIKMLSVLREHFKINKMEDGDITLLIVGEKEIDRLPAPEPIKISKKDINSFMEE